MCVMRENVQWFRFTPENDYFNPRVGVFKNPVACSPTVLSCFCLAMDMLESVIFRLSKILVMVMIARI